MKLTVRAHFSSKADRIASPISFNGRTSLAAPISMATLGIIEKAWAVATEIREGISLAVTGLQFEDLLRSRSKG